MRMPPAALHEPARIARQVAPRRTAIAVIAMLALVAGGTAVAVAVQTKARSVKPAIQAHEPARSTPEPPVVSWDSGTALITDVDGDGVDDVIGLISDSVKPSPSLAAFSGQDGRRLWETTLGADRTTTLALAGATIVRGDTVGMVYAYAVSTGAERWHQPAAERVEQLCAGAGPDEILLQTADHRWLQVPLLSGVMTPLADRAHKRPHRNGVRDGVAPPRCTPLQRADTGAFNSATILGEAPSRVNGMSIRHVLARGNGPRIAYGDRSPGTSVPMLAAFDAAGHVTGRIDVPTSDPLRAKWPSNYLVALTDDAVVVVYETSSGQPMLVSIDRATGLHRWETGAEKVMRMTGIAVSRTAVAVAGWDLLQVFDLERGRAMYVIGHAR